MLIVDGHAGLRRTRRRVLDAERGLRVVGEAPGGATALVLARQTTPDVRKDGAVELLVRAARAGQSRPSCTMPRSSA
jgi:hypothetical protein